MDSLSPYLRSKNQELRSLRSKTNNSKATSKTAKHVDILALDLASKLDGDSHYNFLLKAAWRIPEAELRRIADEAVNRSTTPLWYFIGCVKPMLADERHG